MTEKPTLNVELLRDIVVWAAQDHARIEGLAEKYPHWGRWEQSSWGMALRNGVCQTAYCIAGQACVQAGYQFDWSFDCISGAEVNSEVNHPFDNINPDHTYEYADSLYVYPAIEQVVNGKTILVADTTQEGEDAEDLGQRTLGLTSYEASLLFMGSNSIHSVVGYAMAIADRRGLDLGLPPEIAVLRMDGSIDRMTHGIATLAEQEQWERDRREAERAVAW